MQLKNIIGMMALSLAALTSCTKDFLERAPETSISEAEFWKSTNDMKLYVNNFYNNTSLLPHYGLGAFGTIGIYGLDADQGSDNMISMGVNGMLNGERTVPATSSDWNWGTVRNANYFLANYGKVQDSWDNVKPYVGEALFFRSMMYFNLMKNYGALPWIGTPLKLTDTTMLYGARLPRNQVADSILSDLDKAIAYLPSKTNAQASRVYREMAMAFQARVALYEGSWEKYHAGTPFGVTGSNGAKYFQKAADAAQAVMNSGLFTLDNVGATDGYWRLFNQSDYGSSKEIMFWRKFDVALGLHHNWHRYTTSGAGRGLTKNLVDAYLCTDGSPIALSTLYKGDDSINRVVTNRDPRLAQTMYVPDGKHIITSNQPAGAPNVIFEIPSFNQANEGKPSTGYQVYKGHNTDYNQQNAGNLGITAVIYFRYAEVLLNFAEAKAELGTLSQGDVDNTINKLRDRVGMPGLTLSAIAADPNWEFPALGPVINEVRRERRVELACEGFRRDDIFRWAAADELIVGKKPQGAKKDQWTTLVPANLLNSYPVNDQGYIELFKNIASMANGYKFRVDRDYLLPLPTNELTLNPKLGQNPGWPL
ncbi:RagB/SusD family nutrient uptake outer membrane protein [Chitinophaga caseinilytica]|uniref:RagB/SusD family nutrient uptake outer membrane protein n=1 Tax=Chitinophaga caseinilytica TaxID=2267521 RepID=A0ABZ2Z5P2_9BACT